MSAGMANTERGDQGSSLKPATCRSSMPTDIETRQALISLNALNRDGSIIPKWANLLLQELCQPTLPLTREAQLDPPLLNKAREILCADDGSGMRIDDATGMTAIELLLSHLRSNKLQIWQEAEGIFKRQLADLEKAVNNADLDLLFHAFDKSSPRLPPSSIFESPTFKRD